MLLSDFEKHLKVWKGSDRSDRLTSIFSHIEHYRELEDLHLPVSPVMYVWDIQRNEYLYFSKNVYQYTGYSARELLSRGTALVQNLVHPEDVVSFARINRELRTFMRNLPADAYQNYRLLYSLRVRKADTDTYLQLLIEEAVLQTDAFGTPLLSTGKIVDISHLDSYEGASLYVTEITETGRRQTGFFLYQAQKEVLSRREREVLDLLTEGNTTPEIAERLHISEYTVKNHRKSMLKKTGTNNTASLVRMVYG